MKKNAAVVDKIFKDAGMSPFRAHGELHVEKPKTFDKKKALTFFGGLAAFYVVMKMASDTPEAKAHQALLHTIQADTKLQMTLFGRTTQNIMEVDGLLRGSSAEQNALSEKAATAGYKDVAQALLKLALTTSQTSRDSRFQ